jgi:hypothetical protein
MIQEDLRALGLVVLARYAKRGLPGLVCVVYDQYLESHFEFGALLTFAIWIYSVLKQKLEYVLPAHPTHGPKAQAFLETAWRNATL